MIYTFLLRNIKSIFLHFNFKFNDRIQLYPITINYQLLVSVVLTANNDIL